MKFLIVIAILALTTSCSSHERRLTKNSVFQKKANGTYSLKVDYGNVEKVYDSIQKIGWDENSVLINHIEGTNTGWTYIFDGKEIMKSWGRYSDAEFVERSKELNISDCVTYNADNAWSR